VLASFGLWAIILITKTTIPKSRHHWAGLCILGFLNNTLPFCLIVWGQTQISSGLASIFNATTPIFTVFVAGLLLNDEQINSRKLIGVILGLLGTIVLIGPEVLNGVTGSLLGQIAIIGATFSYAFAATYARRFQAWGISPLMIATGQVTMASVMLLPIAIFFDHPWTLPSLSIKAIGAMLGLAFFSTVIAYSLYFRLIATAGATNAVLVTLLIPISAIILGIVFLGENFTVAQAMGMGFIGLGLLVIDGRMINRVWNRRRANS